MKTHPILFSTEMVQAIIEGRKTQTRRVVKPQPPQQFSNFGNAIAFVTNRTLNHSVYCPYGKVGDVLWVREEHLLKFSDDKEWLFVQFRDGYKYTFRMKSLTPKLQARLLKRKTIGKWQRARFLPKELAGLFLENIGIRVEQLQDISETDAKAEGIDYKYDEEIGYTYRHYLKDKFGPSPIHSFETLWSKINGAESWNANPWVWVVQFKRVDKPANFLQS